VILDRTKLIIVIFKIKFFDIEVIKFKNMLIELDDTFKFIV